MVTIGVALPLGAQATGTPPARPPRDSTFFRVFVPSGRSDTTLTLFLRTLDGEGYGTPGWFSIAKRLDSLLLARKGSGTVIVRGFGRGDHGGPQFAESQGWIGLVPQGLSEQFFDPKGWRVTYFAYPRIISVDPDSPAEHAGIAPGDVLVAYNGIDVIGHEFNLTQLLVPDRKVTVTVRRDGESKDYSVIVSKTPARVSLRRMDFDAAMPPEVRLQVERVDEQFRRARGAAEAAAAAGAAAGEGSRAKALTNRIVFGGPMIPGGLFIITPNGVFGASLVSVSSDLGRVLKLDKGDKGVFVTEVAPQTPASTAGLRVGDVVTSVAGQAVTSVGEVQNIVERHFGEHTVQLQILREKKLKTLTVTLP